MYIFIEVQACMTERLKFNFEMFNIEHVTALMCMFIIGEVAPTFLVYPSNYPALASDTELPKNWLSGIFPNGKAKALLLLLNLFKTLSQTLSKTFSMTVLW